MFEWMTELHIWYCKTHGLIDMTIPSWNIWLSPTAEAGRHELVIPVMINDLEKPYQYLQVVAEMKSPKIWFDPLAIVMTPVPLMTEVTAELTVLAAQYNK